VTLTAAAKGNLPREGYDPVYDAWPLKRLIQKEIQDVLALRLPHGEYAGGQMIKVDTSQILCSSDA